MFILHFFLNSQTLGRRHKVAVRKIYFSHYPPFLSQPANLEPQAQICRMKKLRYMVFSYYTTSSFAPSWRSISETSPL